MNRWKHSMHSLWSYSGVKGAGKGACRSPLYRVPEQGPTTKGSNGENRGQKTQCERLGTASVHKSKDTER